jgi:hypothetical protein
MGILQVLEPWIVLVWIGSGACAFFTLLSGEKRTAMILSGICLITGVVLLLLYGIKTGWEFSST